MTPIPKHTALILEGGGMRGVYTAGVLRFFMERQLWFPYVIGVSMGACNGSNYVSRQPERNRVVNIRFVRDSRFLSYRRLLSGGELFGMPFIFDTIPNNLVPFDAETFLNSEQRFVSVAVDCMTGAAVYFEKKDVEDKTTFLTILQAGCALPLIQKPVRINGQWLMDGGIADSVPLGKSVADGNTRHVLILTQPAGYRKTRSRLAVMLRVRYPRFRGLIRALERRHDMYNQTMDRIDALEDAGKILVIRPKAALGIGRAERNQDKLYAVDDMGYRDAADRLEDTQQYLSADEQVTAAGLY